MLIELSLLTQVAVLALIWVARGWKAASLYVACVPLIWLFSLALQSIHIAAAIHLVWMAPVLIAAWVASEPTKIWLSKGRGKQTEDPNG